MPKTKRRTMRSELLTHVAKICAYVECGKLCEARQWASTLQLYLIQTGLLVDTDKRDGHNGQQSKNDDKSQKGSVP